MGKQSSSSDFSSALGAGAGIGLGNSIGNAGGLMVCNAQNQNTTYCQVVQFFNAFKMLLFFLLVVGLVGYLLYSWFGSGGRRSGGSGFGRRR